MNSKQRRQARRRKRREWPIATQVYHVGFGFGRVSGYWDGRGDSIVCRFGQYNRTVMPCDLRNVKS